jgi:hypothetical protein
MCRIRVPLTIPTTSNDKPRQARQLAIIFWAPDIAVSYCVAEAKRKSSPVRTAVMFDGGKYRLQPKPLRFRIRMRCRLIFFSTQFRMKVTVILSGDRLAIEFRDSGEIQQPKAK